MWDLAERVFSVFICLLVTFVVGVAVYSIGLASAREDACNMLGGVYVDNTCIDKSAVIELKGE